MSGLKAEVWLRSKIESSDYAGNQSVRMRFEMARVTVEMRDLASRFALSEGGPDFNLDIEVRKGLADEFETGKSYALFINDAKLLED